MSTTNWHLPWALNHLPLEELNHVLLQLLIVNTLWKEFRVESRNRHFVFGTKTGKTSLQIIGYFLELILWASFLYLLISRKAWTFFMVITISFDEQKLQKNSKYIYLYICVCVCVCTCWKWTHFQQVSHIFLHLFLFCPPSLQGWCFKKLMHT